MARLYEYQGKALLKEAGIPVPRGHVALTPAEGASIAGELAVPVALKAQVLAGKRGKAGAIRFAATPAEAEAGVRRLLEMTVGGQPVTEVLVEERLDIRREAYVAVTADPTLRSPVVLFSLEGGMDIEELAAERPAAIVKVPVNILRGLPDYTARNVIRRAPGSTSEDVLRLTPVLTALYAVYRRYDAKLVEINPLATTAAGPVAADARVDIDDDAVSRHPELGIHMTEEAGDRPPTPLEVIAGKIDEADHRGTAHFVQIDPDAAYARETGRIPIAFDCVGTGASLTTMDELVPLGYYPVNFADTSGNPPAEKMYRITKVILSQPHIRGYMFISCISSQQLDMTARGIVDALKELYPDSGGKPDIPMLFCFRGAWDAEAIQIFRDQGITDSPWVTLLGRDVSEREAALAFDRLHLRWREAERDRAPSG